ncbi:hypothetical protein U0070_016236 [Myodes glareolus]|uniref:Sister chromatid cohesion protein DCC1 n=1 Tax=Myodes glareolus TaxID=447135 RepID=A0AAW0JHR3_MYOGA
MPQPPTSRRTREEVDATLQVAKLNTAELLPTVHCLSFGPGISGAAAGDFCLLELEPALCQQLEAGHSFVIRGDKDEQAVLCSQDKTYDLKIADTSNMLLVIPGCKTPDQLKREEAQSNIVYSEIFGFSNNYWELRRCRPKLKKLKRLLMENTYEGPGTQKEDDPNRSKYTTEDLLDQIQASEEELMTQLQVLNACEIGGYWRILEFDYEIRLLNHVTQLVDSESWSFSKVPLAVCLQELGPLEPEEMIEHCLNCYGKKYVDEDEVYFELNADKICRVTAEMLLQNAVKFNLAEFQEVWQQSVPEGMTTRLDQLKAVGVERVSSVIWMCGSRAQKRYLSRGCQCYSHEQGRCGLWGRMRSPGQAEKEVMGWGGRLGIDVGSKIEKAVMSEGERGERENVLGISKGLGLALVDRNSRPEIIFLLKVDDLPEGTQERFNSLFSLREKWTEEDIAPYIHVDAYHDPLIVKH